MVLLSGSSLGIAHLCKILQETVCFLNLYLHMDAITSVSPLYASFFLQPLSFN